MTTVVAVLADLHAGSTTAVCPPEIGLDDGGVYQASAAQKELYRLFLDYVDRVSKVRKSLKAKLVVILLGDLIDNNHHESVQVVTGNIYVQGTIFTALYEQIRTLSPDEVYVVRGTRAHAGPSGSDEETLARSIGAVQDGSGNYSAWHLYKVIEGVRLDACHHGKMGGLPWSRFNSLNSKAAQLVQLYAERGWRLPHLAIRADRHKKGDTYDNYPIRVIQCPAWQLHTEFTHRVVPDDLADIGGLIITCNDGKYWVDKVVYPPKEVDEPWI